MAKLRSQDDMMKDYLLDTQRRAEESARDARIKAEDPGYLTQHRDNPLADQYDALSQEFDNTVLADRPRDLGEHLQDLGTGLMGTLGAIGNTAILGVAAAGDALGNVTGTAPGWEATQNALQQFQDTSNHWNSLESEKSQAFDKLTQYREQRALATLRDEYAAAGHEPGTLAKLATSFDSAVGSYLDHPDQIVTDGIAQLPYALTGGASKGIVEGTKLAEPLIGVLSRTMSRESATKLVEMGLVGGMQGTMEGADAASQAYAQVMASKDTFGPGEEAARESAALHAAAKTFLQAGAVSAVTGTLASKFELEPFHAVGDSALARTGDNLVKALQEGLQETIESGNSQYASNIYSNEVLKRKDRVDPIAGVGSAAGQGAIVAGPSTMFTNPRSALDAVAAPLQLAGKAFTYTADKVGAQATAKEQRGDIAAASQQADDIVGSITTPAMTAALNAGVEPQARPDATGQEQTVDTPAENVVLPPEINTKSQLGLFATGMQYLQHNHDTVDAFHVLGAVLASANNIQSLREAAKGDAADESLSLEDREHAKTLLTQLDGMIDNDKLDKWVDDFPMHDIEAELDDLKQNPESFGAVVAHLAARNPMKLSEKVIETALEAKNLPEDQRNALELAQELKSQEAELKVGNAPNSSEVSRSIMQTGFPGGKENDSVAGYISKVTTALDQKDQDGAQHYFNRLVKFSNHLLDRANAYEAAKKKMAADPDSKPVEVSGYGTWNKETGKYDKSKAPVVNKSEGSLAMVAAVRKDADTVAKMVATLSQRTGLQPIEAAPAQEAPVAAPAPTPAKSEAKPAPKAEKPVAARTEPQQALHEDPELAALSDEALGQELDTLHQAISKRRSNATRKAVEQDIRYNALVHEQARRMTAARKTTAKPAVDKPVGKAAPAKAEPAPAPVDKVVENTPAEPVVTQPLEATNVVAHEPAPVSQEPSKNHFSGLQPSYPVAEGATGVEQNDATNHLSQSFTPSDQPGLRSKGEALTDLSKLEEATNVAEDDKPALEATFNVKNKLLARLQKLVNVGGVAKAKSMLAGNKLWANAKSHYLYATQWSAETGIKYHDDIAQIMAWTGVQHMMDMLMPVSWSNDMIQKLEATYGAGIREKLMDGWVPLKDQVEQVARKLQTNLELKGDKKVSVEYTEGTMLALAGRVIEAMLSGNSYAGLLQHETIMTAPAAGSEASPLPVQWVRMSLDKTDMLYDAARIMRDFLPERGNTNQAHIGTASKGVNPLYRGSLQKIGKEQKVALERRNNIEHKLSPLLHNVWEAIPKTNELFFRLFGMDLSVKDFPDNKRELSLSQIARKGANNTTYNDLKVIHQHIKQLQEHVAAQGGETSLYDVPSFFEYEQVTNGRAMTKGTSPQSSKWYRELFAVAQYQVDPATKPRGFLMAVAQGLGVKMDIQKIDESLAKLESLLNHADVKRALEAATRLGDKHDYTNNDALLESDLSAIEKLADQDGLGIELSPHAMSALVHYAQYQKGKPFTSSLMYEIDGKTDGPINLMMLLGLTGSAKDMESALGLSGLFFGDDPIAVQDMTEVLKAWNGGSKDLYEIITKKATALTPELFEKTLATVVDKAQPQHKESTRKQAASLMKATLHLVKLADLAKGDVMNLAMEFARSFSKKSTQAAGYLQGSKSVSADLLNTMLEAISAKMDAGLLTPTDESAIDTFFRYGLGMSKEDGPYFVFNPKGYKNADGSAFVWNGQPLTAEQAKTARNTLATFVGGALFNGLVDTIGYQRDNMMAAVTLMQSRVAYADSVIRDRYKAKQAEEVAAGRLHEGQALSKVDEQAIVKDVWDKLIPHPVLRNTAGLPVGSLDRSNGNPFLGSTPLDGKRRIETRYFESGGGQTFSHYAGLTEAMLEDPGVSFAALSIMAAGDGAMMTGLLSKTKENVLDMYDGLYMSPELIDQMGTALNQEVKANWEHDFIGAILTALQQTEDQGFRDWAMSQKVAPETTLLDVMRDSEAQLKAQREKQQATLRDINSRPHSVSHMAGHDAPAHFPASQPANATSATATTKTDPLLDLALDNYGQLDNGVRTLTKADVVALLNNHTFENPVLSGLWKVLAPLISDGLRLYVSSDRDAMADYYMQNERREMSYDADGTAIGDRVYIRAVNSETLMHELLHYTTKSLVATYYRQASALTAQQREAMRNLEGLMMDFLRKSADGMDAEGKLWVQHAQVVINNYLRNGNAYAAMEEFLAYGLTNYHLQRALNATKARTPLLESIFQAVKKLFGFPAGTKSDSMLAAMFSNFSALTAQAPTVSLPVSPDEALNSIDPGLARSFSDVLNRLQQRSATITQALRAKNNARTRMQELADSNLFPTLTNDQQTAGEYVQAMFSAGLQIRANENALLARVVDAVRDAGPAIWRENSDPSDQADIDLAQARFEFFFENTSTKHDQAADILALTLVNPAFAERLNTMVLPKQKISRKTLNNWFDTSAKALYDAMDSGVALRGNPTLAHALEVAALRMRQSMLQSIKRQETKPGPYQRFTEKLSEGVHLIGEKAGKTAEARMQLQSNKDWITSSLSILAGMTNTGYADLLGKTVLSLTNQLEGFIPARETLQEMVGTVSDNFKLIQLQGIAVRMISGIRQTFREQVPVQVRNWFKDLTPEEDGLLHTVIGKMALYSLSQELKDRMVDVLTDPKDALHQAELLLMSNGDRSKRALMIAHAKRLGDRMAGRGNNALYLNTKAIEGLAVEGGATPLNAKEFAALENISTLQALTHLSNVQRRSVVSLFRNNTEGFWKTTALIHAFHQFDTQRAGQATATMNFQKGWIPVEADGRKKLKLFKLSEVPAAERMGWVQTGKTFSDDPSLVYMATTVGKTPTLSGGAIHAVDFHMNGIHFHSGMPTDPSIQTLITDHRTMKDLQSRILKGEVLPYTALYDAAGDVVGFQRSLDPALVDRHTKSVGRVSEAAGIWLGRLHEERVAHGLNQGAANQLRQTWDEGQAEGRHKEFVNIRQPYDLKNPNPKVDRVILNVWETLPYHTKIQLENAFADGSKNPPIWIRRDQLNDAIGYHKASVTNFFTGDNRYQKATNANVAALSRQILGKNAYKYLAIGEDGWKALISSAKDTIIVKSLVVALNNLAGNQIQMYMITGNPAWNLRVQSQKHKELVSYLGFQQRVARLTAEELATSDPKVKTRIASEQAFLKNEMRKLSIYKLIEAGEMPKIAEGLSESEEFSMVGDLAEWVEKQMGKLPPAAQTVLDNLLISKNTSLYKGLDRMMQYGDFVAKAAMYEWLTTQDKDAKKEALKLIANDTSNKLTMAEALHQVALKEVNDEFVNYARLPGRWRTYGEDMGLLWFYNYKLRIMKMFFRRMRKNPAAFLIGSQVGGVLGLSTLADVLPGSVDFSYSTGFDPLFSAHETIVWNQLF